MGKLENKVAVITGASRGLGLAIAQAYAREGAAVVLAARNQDAVETAAANLRAQGRRVVAQRCDVSDRDQVEALADFAVTTFGRLDVWVNNAGVSSTFGPTPEIDPREFEAVLRTNIFGTYYGSLAAMRRFLAQGSGKLINLTGRGSDRPAPFHNAYSSSKVWVVWFTRALATETQGCGVEVHVFNPGLMFTDLVGKVRAVEGYEQHMKPFAAILRMWGRPPEEAAQKAVWLASPATDGRTGLAPSLLTPRLLLGGALREGLRRLFHRPGPPVEVQVTPIPPYRGR
jgi:glucose 1-dehydrogenase